MKNWDGRITTSEYITSFYYLILEQAGASPKEIALSLIHLDWRTNNRYLPNSLFLTSAKNQTIRKAIRLLERESQHMKWALTPHMSPEDIPTCLSLAIRIPPELYCSVYQHEIGDLL